MPDPSAAPKHVDLIVVTGLSGSGKTTALRALEDAGFFCVDNLPAPLLGTFLRLADEHVAIQRVAVAMDVREAQYDTNLARALADAQAAGYKLSLLFLESDHERLIARYKETRRRHPLVASGQERTTAAAIEREREWLAPIRRLASTLIDTTRTNVHDLKRRVQALYGVPGSHGMSLQLMSFGYSGGVPTEADFVFDVRFVPNPYFVEELRNGTGLDPEVSAYVLSHPSATMMLEHVFGLVHDILPLVETEGRATLTVAIGCTGGQHRSVAMVEALRERLAAEGRDAYVSHRDIPR